jgi:hypothetical protein
MEPKLYRRQNSVQVYLGMYRTSFYVQAAWMDEFAKKSLFLLFNFVGKTVQRNVFNSGDEYDKAGEEIA